EPDHRVNVLAVAAPNAALEHALAGLPTEIGAEQRHRLVTLQEYLHQAADERHHLVHQAELPGCESAGLVGGHGHGIDLPVAELDGHGDIISTAGGADVGQHREVVGAGVALEPAAYAAGALEDRHQRT